MWLVAVTSCGVSSVRRGPCPDADCLPSSQACCCLSLQHRCLLAWHGLPEFFPPILPAASGHKDALEEVQRQATAKGALKAVPLAVSGAFHTPLMQPARDALTQVQPQWMSSAPPAYRRSNYHHTPSRLCLPAAEHRRVPCVRTAFELHARLLLPRRCWPA